jgi:hypothetical protein
MTALEQMLSDRLDRAEESHDKLDTAVSTLLVSVARLQEQLDTVKTWLKWCTWVLCGLLAANGGPELVKAMISVAQAVQ